MKLSAQCFLSQPNYKLVGIRIKRMTDGLFYDFDSQSFIVTQNHLIPLRTGDNLDSWKALVEFEVSPKMFVDGLYEVQYFDSGYDPPRQFDHDLVQILYGEVKTMPTVTDIARRTMDATVGKSNLRDCLMNIETKLDKILQMQPGK